jgi:hypothetical protein
MNRQSGSFPNRRRSSPITPGKAWRSLLPNDPLTTRLLTAQREQLVLERDALDIEWRNLILEENALGDHLIKLACSS